MWVWKEKMGERGEGIQYFYTPFILHTGGDGECCTTNDKKRKEKKQ